MTSIDILILGLSSISAIIFFVLGVSKLIKLYIGLLLGLLICILINLKLNHIASIGITENVVDYFFSKNRGLFGSISILAIPIMGILFLLNSSFAIKDQDSVKSIGSILSTIFFGLMLVPFVLGLYTLINGLGLSNSSFLSSIMDLLHNSSLSNIFSKYNHYIFLLLLGILLYKFILKFLFIILVHFFNRLRELRAEEREIRRRGKEGIDEEDSNEENDTNQH